MCILSIGFILAELKAYGRMTDVIYGTDDLRGEIGHAEVALSKPLYSLTMRSKFLLATTLILPTLFAQTQWEQEGSCPGSSRYSAMAATVNGKAYVGTGQTNSAGDLTSDIWEYDPASDVWTAKANFLGGQRAGVSSFVVADRLFVGFGSTGTNRTNDFYEYLPATDMWMTKASVPGSGFSYAPGFVVGTTCYVGPELGTNAVYAYDTDSDSWTQVADFPGSERSGHAAFALDDAGFLGGGRVPGGSALSDWWSYDPALDSWSEIASMLYVTDESSACVVNGSGYVLNAGSGNGNLYRYDTTAGTWIFESAFPSNGVMKGSLFSIGDKGYLIFGLQRIFANLIPTNELWSFTSVVGVQENGPVNATKVFQGPDGALIITTSLPMRKEGVVEVHDATGRILWSHGVAAGAPLALNVPNSLITHGLLVVRITTPDEQIVRRLIAAPR